VLNGKGMPRTHVYYTSATHVYYTSVLTRVLHVCPDTCTTRLSCVTFPGCG